MSVRKLPVALAAATLAIAPVAVQAAPVERASAPTAQDSELRGGTLLWVAAIIAIIIGGILLFDNDDNPASP